MRYAVQLSSASGRTSSIARRYREWAALREVLTEIVPNVGAPFPPKRIDLFAICDMSPGRRHDANTVVERAAAFECWAVELLAMSGACELHPVRVFFGLDQFATPAYWRPWAKPDSRED